MTIALGENHLTEDCISTLLHNTYSKVQLVDCGSEFNTSLPQQLVDRVQLLGVSINTCNEVLDFFTERQHTVNRISRKPTITVDTESPQGCVPSPLHFSLLIDDCAAKYNTNYMKL